MVVTGKMRSTEL